MRNETDLGLRKEEINLLLSGTAGHLNGSIVPAIGHLPVCFYILMPGGEGGGNSSGGWVLPELTDALPIKARRGFVY